MHQEHQWTPHSPDLNPPDFYLWGFVKDHVYENRPQSIAELRTKGGYHSENWFHQKGRVCQGDQQLHS